jgi:hypothetical protein
MKKISKKNIKNFLEKKKKKENLKKFLSLNK